MSDPAIPTVVHGAVLLQIGKSTRLEFLPAPGKRLEQLKDLVKSILGGDAPADFAPRFQTMIGGHAVVLAAEEELDYLIELQETSNRLPLRIAYAGPGITAAEKNIFSGRATAASEVLVTGYKDPTEVLAEAASVSGGATAIETPDAPKGFLCVKFKSDELTYEGAKQLSAKFVAIPRIAKWTEVKDLLRKKGSLVPGGSSSSGSSDKGGKKRSRSKSKSTVTTVLALKYWKNDYLRKKCKRAFDEIASEDQVTFRWASSDSKALKGNVVLEIHGNAKNTKEAKKKVEKLASKLLVAGTLTIICLDGAHKFRVINQCRALEVEYDFSLLAEEDLQEESKAATRMRVMVISQKKDLFEVVKKKFALLPKQEIEKKCSGLSRGQVDALRQLKRDGSDKINEIKKAHKVSALKILRGKVYIKTRTEADFIAAEKDLKEYLSTVAPAKVTLSVAELDPFERSFSPESGGKLSLAEMTLPLSGSPGGGLLSPLSSGAGGSFDFKPSGSFEDGKGFLSASETSSVFDEGGREGSVSRDRLSVASTDDAEPSVSKSAVDGDVVEEAPEDDAKDEEPAPVEEVVVEAASEAEVAAAEEEYDDSSDLPESWDRMTKKVNAIPALLLPDSDEWKFVANHLDFSANIISIERIQNKFLWRKFAAEKKEAAGDSGTSVTAMYWCGSGATPPDDIYLAESASDGFAKGGYEFWKRSSFCGVFAYSTTNGSKQLFLAETITGGRSKMVIKATKAYPHYLVTFK